MRTPINLFPMGMPYHDRRTAWEDRTSRYHWRRGFICGVVSSAGALFFGGLLGCIFAYLA
jgi:hypothetical protein